MNEPKSLDSLFKEKIFRIPDYQRGVCLGKRPTQGLLGRPHQLIWRPLALYWGSNS